MKLLPVYRRDDPIAEHKLLIIRQQTLVAKLQRAGHRQQASAARGKLYAMLDRLDLLLEEAGLQHDASPHDSIRSNDAGRDEGARQHG